MIERKHAGIIAEHLSHFFLRKTSHLVELWCQRVVGTDIETTRQVVHGDRTDTGDKDSSKGSSCRTLDGVEELAKITLAMGLLAITLQVLLVGKDIVGEVVVLIDEEIDALAYFRTNLAEIPQLFHSPLTFVHLFLRSFWKETRIDIAEEIKHNVAMPIHTSLIIVESCTHLGKVEMDDEIRIALRGRILTYVQSTEEGLKLVLLVDVIVIF